MTADEALDRIKEGNKRFQAGNLQHPHTDPDYRSSLTGGQKPFAVVLTCADSRVPPEHIFDVGLGDLFVIRVAGNVAKDKVTGSIEYAVKYLGSKLVVVMGHESCGAVGAATSTDDPGGHIGAILEKIKPAVHAARGMEGDLLTNAVKMNARMTAGELSESKPILLDHVQNEGVKVVSAYYKLSNGEVEFL